MRQVRKIAAAVAWTFVIILAVPLTLVFGIPALVYFKTKARPGKSEETRRACAEIVIQAAEALFATAGTAPRKAARTRPQAPV